MGFSGGTFNFFPTFGIDIYPYGNFGISLYVIIMTYAILKFRLMNVNVAVTRSVIFLFTYGAAIIVPFWFGYCYQRGLRTTMNEWWWVIPVGMMGVLSSLAPSGYLWAQKRAEDRLLKDRQRYQMTLLQLSAGITRIRDMKKLTRLIVHLITRSAGIEHASLFLLEGKGYEMKANRYCPFSARPEIFNLNSEPVQSLNRLRKSLVAEELRFQQYPNLVPTNLLASLDKLQASVVVPIFIDTELLGFLSLGAKRSKETYAQSDLEVFSTLANQAALAIENATVFEELAKTQAEVVRQETRATTDALTGLLVRRAFLELAEKELKKPQHKGNPYSLLMIDLDHFKEKNDTYGHLAGDMVLQEVATRLQGTLRQGDLLGRFGGEEFILLLPTASVDLAHTLAQRLKDSVCSRPIAVEGKNLEQTLSIGVASCPQDGDTLVLLIARADEALCAAKRAGRNQIMGAQNLK